MLPCTVSDRLPFIPIIAFKFELAQHPNAQSSGIEVRIRRGRFLYTCSILQLGRQVFTNIGTGRAPIFYTIGIPIGTMPYALATFTATCFAAITDLLMVSDSTVFGIVVHLPTSY